jgi:sugar phosphate isomerase/epimerase
VLFRTDSIPEEPYPQRDRPVYHEALRLGIDRLINLVDGRLILCVENYKMDHETLQVLDRHIGAGDLFLCWDVAKSRGKPEVQEYFLQHLDSVKQVHLHDFWQREGIARSHRVIGSGELDFTQLLPILARADVLDYCIEVRPREKALQSLAALRRMVTELDLEKGP